VAQAKSGFTIAHAARVEYVLARRRGAVALDGGRGSCGDHGGGRPRPRRAVRPCFLPVRRGLASGFKGAKRIKHTRRAAEYSCEDPVGDSNGSGGGGGEAVVLVKEGIRVEASLRCARSEDGTMALPLLTLLPPLLPPLLLRAVGFPGAFATVVAGGRPVGAQRSVRPRAAAQPRVVAGAGVAAGRESLLGRSRTSGKGISAWIFSSC